MFLFLFIYLQRPEGPPWFVTLWAATLAIIGVVILASVVHLLINWNQLTRKERRSIILGVVAGGYGWPMPGVDKGQ